MEIFVQLKNLEVSITTIAHIPQNFVCVSGLKTNVHKSTIVPISYDHINIGVLLQELPVIRSSFPIQYLGLPLTHKRLRRVDFQPLVDKARSKLAGWQGRLLTPTSHITLVKSVLTSTPIYSLTALKVSKTILWALDRARQQFLWSDVDMITGGNATSTGTGCADQQTSED